MVAQRAKSRLEDFVEDSVSMIGRTLHEGEQTRELRCPHCDGGQSQEKSFAIRKIKGVVFYRCYRLSCRIRGRLVQVGSLFEHEKDVPLRAVTATYVRAFTGRIVPVNRDGEDFFEEQFSLLPSDLDFAEIKYAPESNRYVFPVHDNAWRIRGISLRSFEPNTQKWDHFPSCTPDQPWIGWYIRTAATFPRGPIVVVEDPISSLKVGRQFTSCYLNGTSLDYDKLFEIMRMGRGRGVILALDKDATAKAIEFLSEYSFYLGGEGIACPVEKDPKYMSDKEIRELFTRKT